MDTFFAPAERAKPDDLKIEIDSIANSPLVDGLLNATNGLLAVLNEQRQIVALNSTLLKMLDIEDPEAVLGFRPGEAIGCVHAHSGPGGCGTSEACPSCGAAIAIVSCLNSKKPAENICAAKVQKNNLSKDLYLKVQAVPITLDNRGFLLLFLQDITRQQQLAALERVFFHDISNLAGGLIGTSELLVDETNGFANKLAMEMRQLARHVVQEIQLQRSLSQSDLWNHKLNLAETTANRVLAELNWLYHNHPAAKNKSIRVEKTDETLCVKTDVFLLSRILANLVTNALEATKPGGEVRLWVRDLEHSVAFQVWNDQHIPEAAAKRIFQRNFTTKQGSGRGLGTFSTKLFGEQLLKGKVQFTTSADTGTTFELSLPK